MNGDGEAISALMLRVIGGEAGDVSEVVRKAVDKHAAAFRDGDVLRMLKLLAEAEQVIRRSPNARLHVETLLVQWTLLDRTVELAEVLEALGGGGTAVRREVARPPPVRPLPPTAQESRF